MPSGVSQGSPADGAAALAVGTALLNSILLKSGMRVTIYPFAWPRASARFTTPPGLPRASDPVVGPLGPGRQRAASIPPKVPHRRANQLGGGDLKCPGNAV